MGCPHVSGLAECQCITLAREKSNLCHMKGNSRVTKLVQRSLYPFIGLIISLLLYAAVLIVRLPPEIGLTARNGLFPVLIAIALLLYPAYRRSGWTGTLASLSLTLILFALPLSGLWNSGVSEDVVIGGLLPWSDASGYYWDAKRLLEGGTFSAFSSRRPLFPGMLAPLLGLTQQNLQVTLAILVAITAISCFFLARELKRSHGTAAGLLVLTILFLFYRRYIGKSMTENLGLALGTLGFALLWRGAWQKQINNCLFGLFLLTLALNARAGALLILPAIILWGTWAFRGTNRFSPRFLLGGSSVVLLGFILNSFVLKIVASSEGMGFSNFSYILYSLIVGGDWGQVLVDHPEIKALEEPEFSQKIYALAFEALRANPLGLFWGSLRAWKEFIVDDYVFSFIYNLKVNFFLQILSLIALLNCYRQRQEPIASLMMVTTFGILVSVPFAPPWATEIMRAYAATMPFVAVLPVLGLLFLTKKLEWQQQDKVLPQDNSSQFLRVFSIILVAFVIIAPITTRLLSRPPQFANVSCQDGTPALYSRVTPGSSIKLVADDSIRQTHLPNVRLSDFRNGLAPFGIGYPDLAKELANLSPSTTITYTLNLRNLKQQIWLIADSSKLPKERGIVGVCGKWSTNPQAQQFAFFYADSIQKVSAINN